MSIITWLLMLLLFGFLAPVRSSGVSESGCIAVGSSDAVDDETLCEMDSALKNAATAMESYYTSAQTYKASVNDLVKEGLRIPDGVELNIAIATDTRYCIEANGLAHYDSDEGTPRQGLC